MLFKTTLRLLLVNTDTKSILLPIVSNNYKNTLWLLKHRKPSAVAIGIVEGPHDDLSSLKIGEVDIAKLHQIIIRTTNAYYTSIGKQPHLPNTFELDYSLDTEVFIIKYAKLFTPDEFMVILGTKHSKIFKIIGHLVLNKKFIYVPNNGPGKWSYYDYFWLHERYRTDKLLDIKDIINRPVHQIKTRAMSIGITRRAEKRIVSNVLIEIQPATDTTAKCICGRKVIVDNQCGICASISLSAVERDYMESQISGIVTNILNNK